MRRRPNADTSPLVCDGGEAPDEGVVLVVDDDEEFAETVELWLSPRWDVRLAHDGAEALETYGPHVDVVLLDRRMPNVSGDEALEKLRERDGDARIALMTAVEPDWDIVDMDFDMYLQKPVSRADLVESVEELLRWEAYSRELQAMYALGRKIGTLQANYPADELETDERYRRLQTEFERVRERAEQQTADLDDEEFKHMLQIVEETR